jgi:hypothetical protein
MSFMYRLKFEDVNLEPIDDYDVFDSKTAALNAFADEIAHPTPGVGSVYLTEDRNDIDVVIAGHYFVDTTDL